MPIRDLMCCALAVGLAASGCGKKDDKAPADKGSSARTTTANGGTAGSAAPSGEPADVPLPPVVEIDKAAVQKTLDAWLAAQNGGDFVGYQGLYAEKMEGVKRVGTQTWRFDRKGWLADRERMFKHPMTVAMRDVKISGSAMAPVVELVQSFQQGKFADEGTKRLVLAKGRDGLRIAREEMLRSEVGSMPATASGDLWLPLSLDKKPYVVIADDVSDTWGSGRLGGPFQEGFYYATRDASKAPPAAAWMTRDLAVYGGDGKRCAAKVSGLELIAGGTPHNMDVSEWNGAGGMEAPWSKPRQAREIYGRYSKKLIGELTIDGACEPALVTDAKATPTVFASAPADPVRDAAATAAFRKLPAYATIQRDFVDNYEGKGAWVKAPRVQAFAGNGRTIVVVSAREGNGCAEFLGELTVVFDDKGGKLVPRAPSGYIFVEAVVDIEGDGAIELIGRPDDFETFRALYVDSAGGFAPQRTVDFEFNDCGC